MKTPEELAEEYADYHVVRGIDLIKVHCQGTIERTKNAWLAGYQTAAPQWISVKDRLPEARRLVLYLHELHGHSVGYYDPEYPKPNYQWISLEWGDNNNARITHWMPLPSSPEVKE